MLVLKKPDVHPMSKAAVAGGPGAPGEPPLGTGAAAKEGSDPGAALFRWSRASQGSGPARR